ncbi:catalase family protein [Lichenihabitans sp. Uapishka_5]|uniref:catalase family protein n=1 Tax=Lichenihabitans sp. Uapishka_5 TaxID=3037302 RepID=UPI0029E7E850|nr:catalase family protein [Lichenihabitans sp. Uapishka_5]MDX7951387.1 catalase family protein [Lichenihabitans sp. Uapishka_5]
MGSEPIRYHDGLETVQADEAQIHAEMIETFNKIQNITAKDYGRAVRGVHAKSHGVLVGRLAVLPNLPPAYAQGFCASPGQHDVVLRLSTNPGDILDDSVSTPRGLAVKVMGVEGERLPGEDGTSQDFVMANAPGFTAPDAKAFLRSLKLLATTTDTPQIFKKGLSAVLRNVEAALEAVGTKSPTLISLGGHPETHILGETFYSQVPLRWGDYVAKVAVAPLSPGLTELTGAPLDVNGVPDGLRNAVSNFFAVHAGTWEVRVQLLTDLDTMPIEDASKVWSEDESPYVPVARIDVARQDSWSDGKIRSVDEGASFNPWHCLAAHRPLGSIMRARRAIYPKSAAFRAAHNGCPIHELASAAEVGE